MFHPFEPGNPQSVMKYVKFSEFLHVQTGFKNTAMSLKTGFWNGGDAWLMTEWSTPNWAKQPADSRRLGGEGGRWIGCHPSFD